MFMSRNFSYLTLSKWSDSSRHKQRQETSEDKASRMEYFFLFLIMKKANFRQTLGQN